MTFNVWNLYTNVTTTIEQRYEGAFNKFPDFFVQPFKSVIDS